MRRFQPWLHSPCDDGHRDKYSDLLRRSFLLRIATQALAYVHVNERELRGEADPEYFAMWEEFLLSVKHKWPNAIVQFEDISNDHCFALLRAYRNKLKCFNDDIQGNNQQSLRVLMV